MAVCEKKEKDGFVREEGRLCLRDRMLVCKGRAVCKGRVAAWERKNRCLRKERWLCLRDSMSACKKKSGCV